jgi:hypothetical protein
MLQPADDGSRFTSLPIAPNCYEGTSVGADPAIDVVLADPPPGVT